MTGGCKAHIKPISRASFIASRTRRESAVPKQRSASGPHVLGRVRALAAMFTANNGWHLDPDWRCANHEFADVADPN